jgi:hypothetical protein
MSELALSDLRFHNSFQYEVQFHKPNSVVCVFLEHNIEYSSGNKYYKNGTVIP